MTTPGGVLLVASLPAAPATPLGSENGPAAVAASGAVLLLLAHYVRCRGRPLAGLSGEVARAVVFDATFVATLAWGFFLVFEPPAWTAGPVVIGGMLLVGLAAGLRSLHEHRTAGARPASSGDAQAGEPEAGSPAVGADLP